MCIRDSYNAGSRNIEELFKELLVLSRSLNEEQERHVREHPVSYTHLRAHETVLDLVCRLLLEKKKKTQPYTTLREQQKHNTTTHSLT